MVEVSRVFHAGDAHAFLGKVLQCLLQDLLDVFAETSNKWQDIVWIIFEYLEVFLNMLALVQCPAVQHLKEDHSQ